MNLNNVQQPGWRYVLISPCRDEAKFMRKTLDSVIAQSVQPGRWVIVDDGSTDDSPQILEEYASQHDWIEIVRREDRGERSVGPGVIDAFYAGFKTINLSDYDFICKLDLDLVMPETYFQTLIQMMHDNPRLGSISGKTFYIDSQSGEAISEKIGDEMSIGASKFYRRTCFEQIGGFVRQVMWDGIDVHTARMLGWQAGSFDRPGLHFEHLRPMGSSDRNIIRGRLRHGFGQYFMGTSLIYMTAAACYRMTRPPVIRGGLAMWWGYVRSAIKGVERYPEPELRRFVRRFQWRALRHGKKQATQITEAEMEPAFDPNRPPRRIDA